MSHVSPQMALPRQTPLPAPRVPQGPSNNGLMMDPLSTRLDNYANILLTNHPAVSNPYDVKKELTKIWERDKKCHDDNSNSNSFAIIENPVVMTDSMAIGQDVYKFDNMPKTLVGDLSDAVEMIYNSFHRLDESTLPVSDSLYNLIKWSNVYMRILLNLVKVPDNCKRLGLCKIPAYFAWICLHLFSPTVNKWDTEAQLNSLRLITDMIEFFDYLYDPLRLWRNHSVNQILVSDIIVEVPPLIDSFPRIFIDGLRKGWDQETPHYAKLQTCLINVFGAAMFGSVSNALGILNPSTVMALMSFLSPDPTSGLSKMFTGPILEIIVKIIHMSVSFKEQVGITNSIILRCYLELLNPTNLTQFGTDGIHLMFNLLQRIPDICSTNDKSIIQCEFEVAGIFSKMMDILGQETTLSEDDNRKLCAHVLEAITACLSSCSASKTSFETIIGYARLVKIVHKKVSPCEEVLEPFVLMVIETASQVKMHRYCVVQNVPLLLTLLEFISELKGTLQVWFSRKIHEICVQSSLSALKCSLDGVTLKLLNVVESVQDGRLELEKESLEAIFKILEFFGRHSISALELKQMIALVRATQEGKQPPYSARLVKCLEEIATKDGRIKAQSYFDLHDSNSGISLPAISWPGSAFTFHCWIFVDPTSQTIMSSPSHLIDNSSTLAGNMAAFPIRRIIYSFLTYQNVGFEAFITPDCHLVVAVSTKKEFYTYEIRNFPLNDYNWHSLAIVHKRPKQILSDQSECAVYVDGEGVRFSFRMPHLKDTLRHCHIGNRPGVNPADVPNLIYPRQTKPPKFVDASTVCPINHQHEIWGYPGSLGGLLGSVVVFSDALAQPQISSIHLKGTNDLSTFHSCPLTSDLGSKMVVFYHPAACLEEKCQDLTPSHIYPDQKLTGKFSGQCYTTHDIRYIINHIGGIELLFPLLENVLLSQSVANSGDVLMPTVRLDEVATATGEYPLALCGPGGFFSNSLDNLNTTHDHKNSNTYEAKTSSLDFLNSPLSPLPHHKPFSKIELRKAISNPLSRCEKVTSTPNLRVSSRHASDAFPLESKDFHTKHSMPHDISRSNSLMRHNSEDASELNPKIKLLEEFPGVLQGDMGFAPPPKSSIAIYTMPRKLAQGPNKLSKPRSASTKVRKTSQFYFDSNSSSTSDSKAKSEIILAQNPEDVHNFDTLTSYLDPAPPPKDNHKLTPHGFFRLLHAFLLHLPSNQQKFYDVLGPATVAALLQKLPTNVMGIATFEAVRNFTHYLRQFNFDDSNHLQELLKNWILDFKLWSRSSFEVRVEHLQLVCSFLKDMKDELRCEYGIKYFLHVIRRYYTSENTFTPRADFQDSVKLTQKQTVCLVGALMNIIKFYMRDSVDKDEFEAILSFLVAVRDTIQLESLLRKIHQLLSRGEGNGCRQFAELIVPHGHWLLVLLESDSPQVRNLVLKVIMDLLYSPSIRSSIIYQCVDNGNLNVALGRMYGLELNEQLASYLVSICISTESDSIVEFILNVDVLLTTMKLLRDASVLVRLRACQQVMRAIFHNPHHAKEIAKVPKWIFLMLHLLMKPREFNESADSETKPDEKSSKYLEEMFHCLTRIINVVMWYGVLRDRDSMAEWAIVFYAVDTLTRENQMLFSATLTKNRLMYLLVDQATLQAEAEGESTQLTMRTLVISRLLESFIFGITEDSEELKLSSDPCNIHLLQTYFKLLSQLQIFLVCFTDEELIEIEHIALRIFLGCLAIEKQEVYLTVSQLITPVITSGFFNLKSEIPFIIGSLHYALNRASDSNNKQHQKAILLVLKQLYQSVTEYLLEDSQLPHPPQLADNPILKDDITAYLSDKEYQAFLAENDVMMGRYETTVINPSIAETRQCLRLASEILADHESHSKEYKKSATAQYVEIILKPFYKLREEAREEMKSQDNKDSVNYYTALVGWKRLRTFYMSPQGAWSSRKTEESIWKLEPTENFSRMHMKLVTAPGGTRHSDASKLRDCSQITVQAKLNPGQLGALPKNVQDSSDFLADLDADIPTVDPSAPEGADPQSLKKVQVREKCQLIFYMESIPGTVEVTNKYVQFVPDSDQENKEVLTSLSNINIFPVFKWDIKKVREVHFRRYNLRKTALEFFLLDQTNYLLNFEKKTMTRVYHAVMSLKPPKIRYADIRSPTKLLTTSGLTDKWVRREISNFEYLMQLNTIAGRTFNDFNQYPVFPWVITDYSSATLSVENHSIYRDLSKPVGALNSRNEETVRVRYREFVDPSGELPPFHYGTHYSNAASVLHYLIRLEPFTTFHVDLQSGKFDHADRQFYSLESTYQKCYDGLDVKELIPEFFYLPEMFENSNQLDLGVLQTNAHRIQQVLLPPWANSSEDFIVKHRQCLESEYVSAHLHEWIDLIFGFKQRGKEAEKAANVFYYCTYEGAVNLDKIKDPKDRASIESMIKNFGQTPSQLFREPHLKRLSPEEALKSTRHKIDLGESSQKRPPNILNNFKNGLKAYCVEVCKEPIVFIGTQLVSCSLIYRGNFDHLVTINSHAVCQTHQWLASSSSRKSHPFTFNLDPKAQLDRSHWCSLGGHFAPDVGISSKLFAISQDGKLILSVGHWDKTMKVSRNQKLISVIRQHHDIVTCVAADRGGEHFITGSKDTTCKIWEVVDPTSSSGLPKGIQERPTHTLYGQVTSVTAVAISVELDLAVSGARDGNCILYSVHQGVFIRALPPLGGEILNMSISEQGRIVTNTRVPPHSEKEEPSLHLYTLNGKHLQSYYLSEPVVEMLTRGHYLITGGNKGTLSIRDLNSLKSEYVLHLHEQISSLCLIDNETHLLAGLSNGKLIVVVVELHK